MSFKLSEVKKNAHFHFIGIGGISMSGLAKVLLTNGYKVTGSDMKESGITRMLEEAGIKVYIGHNGENVVGSDVVVYTAAVKQDNCEFIYAKKKGIELIERAVLLGELMLGYKHAIAVGGTHGKTTTTSIISSALLANETDPTISLGGELDIIGGNMRIGGGDTFLTEACEYHCSFLHFHPTIAVITNVEADHLDYFRDLEHIIDVFRDFALLTKGIGAVVACGEDDNIKKALEGTECNVYTYGEGQSFDFHPVDIKVNQGYYCFGVMYKGERICDIVLKVPGRHNMLNALASVAVCYNMGLDMDKVAKGISDFSGTRRRFEKKGNLNGALVIDDYAHHPTEIKATLSAAKDIEHNKIWCVFQPHTYTRTRELMKDFSMSFDYADKIIITKIYAAREPFDASVKEMNLVDMIKKCGKDACFIESLEDISQILKKDVETNDIVFTMGAGNVVDICDMILE